MFAEGGDFRNNVVPYVDYGNIESAPTPIEYGDFGPLLNLLEVTAEGCRRLGNEGNHFDAGEASRAAQGRALGHAATDRNGENGRVHELFARSETVPNALSKLFNDLCGDVLRFPYFWTDSPQLVGLAEAGLDGGDNFTLGAKVLAVVSRVQTDGVNFPGQFVDRDDRREGPVGIFPAEEAAFVPVGPADSRAICCAEINSEVFHTQSLALIPCL